MAFVLPITLAWLIFFFGDNSGQGNNHGQLILPPRTLDDVPLYDLNHTPSGMLYGKWNIVYIHDGLCEKSCSDNLYKMRQIRLATNKYAHRLQRVLILDTDKTELFQNAITDDYQGQLLLFKKDLPDGFIQNFDVESTGQAVAKGGMYIIDPIGNLMMVYAADADPIGIIEDLTHLIKISRIG